MRASHVAVQVRHGQVTYTNTSDGRTPGGIEELTTVIKDQIIALSACDVQEIVVEMTMEHSRLLVSIHFLNAIGLGSHTDDVELRHCKEEEKAARGMKEGRLVQVKMGDVPLDFEPTRRNSPQPTLIIL